MQTIIKPTLSNIQKAALVALLLTQAGNAVEVWEDLQERNESLQGITAEEAALQFALWLQRLPGTVWDERLPQV
jgi:hypothetical protein